MTGQELDTQKMFTRIEGKLSKLETSTERIEKSIFGNGREGLLERVTRLETKVGIFAAIAGVVGSGIIELIKHVF
ncbi:MAG: hypothetical protein J5654_06205 [Victivallales bacterium]|nr:hypothetical protein [Victivallales bacterium]